MFHILQYFNDHQAKRRHLTVAFCGSLFKESLLVVPIPALQLVQTNKFSEVINYFVVQSQFTPYSDCLLTLQDP